MGFLKAGNTEHLLKHTKLDYLLTKKLEQMVVLWGDRDAQAKGKDNRTFTYLIIFFI